MKRPRIGRRLTASQEAELHAVMRFASLPVFPSITRYQRRLPLSDSSWFVILSTRCGLAKRLRRFNRREARV